MSVPQGSIHDIILVFDGHSLLAINGPAYHRWAVDPREFMTDAVTDRLRASGNFTQVKRYDGHSDIDYVLSERLEQLEEIDYQGSIKVEIAISAQITRLASDTGSGLCSEQRKPIILVCISVVLERPAVALTVNPCPVP